MKNGHKKQRGRRCLWLVAWNESRWFWLFSCDWWHFVQPAQTHRGIQEFPVSAWVCRGRPYFPAICHWLCQVCLVSVVTCPKPLAGCRAKPWAAASALILILLAHGKCPKYLMLSHKKKCLEYLKVPRIFSNSSCNQNFAGHRPALGQISEQWSKPERKRCCRLKSFCQII